MVCRTTTGRPISNHGPRARHALNCRLSAHRQEPARSNSRRAFSFLERYSMPEATQTATPTDARQASMSRVQTQDSVIASLAPQKAASVPAEGKPDAEKDKDEGDQKPKRAPASESRNSRPSATKPRRKPRSRASAEPELEGASAGPFAQAKPMEAGDKPLRSQYATDDEYIEVPGGLQGKGSHRQT
jgi:hypothetical protein